MSCCCFSQYYDPAAAANFSHPSYQTSSPSDASKYASPPPDPTHPSPSQAALHKRISNPASTFKPGPPNLKTTSQLHANQASQTASVVGSNLPPPPPGPPPAPRPRPTALHLHSRPARPATSRPRRRPARVSKVRASCRRTCRRSSSRPTTRSSTVTPPRHGTLSRRKTGTPMGHTKAGHTNAAHAHVLVLRRGPPHGRTPHTRRTHTHIGYTHAHRPHTRTSATNIPGTRTTYRARTQLTTHARTHARTHAHKHQPCTHTTHAFHAPTHRTLTHTHTT